MIRFGPSPSQVSLLLHFVKHRVITLTLQAKPRETRARSILVCFRHCAQQHDGPLSPPRDPAITLGRNLAFNSVGQEMAWYAPDIASSQASPYF